MISRRTLLRMGLVCLGGFFSGSPGRALAGAFPQFYIAQVRYRGGQWDPNPQFTDAITNELELRTSIDASRERRTVSLADPELFSCPFLYMAGKYEFDPWTAKEREILRRYLTFGGFLLAEDVMGVKGFGFDAAFRREMRQVFPGRELQKLPPDHSVFQSFYLVNIIGGRQKINAYLEGIVIDNWTPVIYSQNDLAGAWSRDRSGKWLNECVPGGEAQRLAAFKTGVNIIVYSLTSDYKKDLVHHPFIKRRQNL
ncbi:MAG TPA: DUF4159 domain-containing protein [Syntrophorhabdales bacterium]|nr:DUF4159 domain-containing protein [Syntrophorhabdales bacterium]